MKEFEASEFDLAIVDIFLQESNGFDVIKVMREHVANLPVVAISGMTALDFVNASPEPRDVICLLKPFRPNELIRAVEAAQRAPRPPAAVAASENRGAFRERA